MVLFDDILVYSKIWNEHLKHLRRLLEILAANQLFTKALKCQFGITQVEYLGHIIVQGGVSIDPSKIKAINRWPTPTTTRDV